MNITFMLGNGFDINMGLKTSYPEFLRHYLAQPKKNDVLERFRQSINAELPNWTDVEIAIGRCTRDFFGDTASEDFMACYDDLYDCLAAYLAEQESYSEGVSEMQLRQAMEQVFSQWQGGFRQSRSQVIAERIQRCSGGFSFNFITF